MSSRIPRLFDLVLKLAVVAVALALAYFATDYVRKTRTLGSILLYYAGPSVLLAALVAALRSKPDTRANVALLLVFTVVPLYAIEGVIQLRQALRTEYGLNRSEADAACPRHLWNREVCLDFKARGERWDTRTAVQVYKDGIAAGEDVWPALDAMHLRDSLLLQIDGRPVLALSPGVSNVSTILCNETGEWLSYLSDERGFNNPPGLHVADSVTVALVGDSFVHGWCVPQEATIGAQLRGRFPKTVNLGFHGAGPLTTLGTLREYAAPLRPEFVIWLYFEGNDQIDLARELRVEALETYLDPSFSQGLSTLQPELDRSLRDWIVDLQERDDRRYLARQARSDSISSAPGNHPLVRWLKLRTLRQAPRRFMESRRPDPGPWEGETTLEILRRAADDVESWGGTFVIGVLPAIEPFVEGVPPDREERIASFDELGVTVVDLMDLFAEHPDPASTYWPIVGRVHYNEVGYALVAEALADTLQNLMARRVPQAGDAGRHLAFSTIPGSRR